jgi:TonB-dependent starch-binding outer membrane protein SusC
VSVSYELPERLARSASVQRAVITLAGRNLHTWTNFSGLDPEGRSQIANIVQFDQAITPSLAQFIATFNFTF